MCPGLTIKLALYPLRFFFADLLKSWNTGSFIWGFTVFLLCFLSWREMLERVFLLLCFLPVLAAETCEPSKSTFSKWDFLSNSTNCSFIHQKYNFLHNLKPPKAKFKKYGPCGCFLGPRLPCFCHFQTLVMFKNVFMCFSRRYSKWPQSPAQHQNGFGSWSRMYTDHQSDSSALTSCCFPMATQSGNQMKSKYWF